MEGGELHWLQNQACHKFDLISYRLELISRASYQCAHNVISVERESSIQKMLRVAGRAWRARV